MGARTVPSGKIAAIPIPVVAARVLRTSQVGQADVASKWEGASDVAAIIMTAMPPVRGMGVRAQST